MLSTTTKSWWSPAFRCAIGSCSPIAWKWRFSVLGINPFIFFNAHVIFVWQWPFNTGTLIRKSIFAARSQTFSFIPLQSLSIPLSFCISQKGTWYFSVSSRYPHTSYASVVLSPTQEPSRMAIFPYPFSCRYSIIPATISGCVVAPHEASEGDTRLGLIPICIFLSEITDVRPHCASSSFVISL